MEVECLFIESNGIADKCKARKENNDFIEHNQVSYHLADLDKHGFVAIHRENRMLLKVVSSNQCRSSPTLFGSQNDNSVILAELEAVTYISKKLSLPIFCVEINQDKGVNEVFIT